MRRKYGTHGNNETHGKRAPFSCVSLFPCVPYSFLLAVVLFSARSVMATEFAPPVRFTRGTLEVPTYRFERSEGTAPLFKSAASHGLYPYAVLDRDSLSRVPVPIKYESLTLENEYLRVIVLPELGGRIWSAWDKIARREIFYRTSVIKPTVYNQREGWPAGNLEVYGPYDAHMLTWPGEPWPWAFTRDESGGASITLSHIDHLFRNKVSMTVTLRPGRSFIELSVNLRNNNTLANRYLLWTNAGVSATDGTRFVYPMTRTIAHVSSDIGTWPTVDGADLSWYKNNPAMLGVFGLDLYDDFIAAYDYEADYGTVCFANRKIARGVKTWTWGVGDAARRQMKHYTDRDGPYLEVQSGRFVWDGNYEFIEPGKSDGWTEYWFGTGELGGLETATRDVAVSFELPRSPESRARLAVRTTGRYPQASLTLKAGEKTLWNVRRDLSPETVDRETIEIDQSAAGRTLTLEVAEAKGVLLARYVHRPDGSHPEVVFASDSIPRKFGAVETLSAEEAFQKGLAHEKFGEIEDARLAYEAALAKDRLFTSPRLRLGAVALERRQYETAIEQFMRVLERDPGNGETHYSLAVAYFELEKNEEARRHFYRLLPSHAKYDQRDYGLGLLALRENQWAEAVAFFSRAASVAPNQVSIRQAYSFALRKSGRLQAARGELDSLKALDPTNAFAEAERIFLSLGPKSVPGDWSLLDRACAHHEQGYLELATEYMRLSAWKEAGAILDRGVEAAGKSPIPMLLYYQAYLADRLRNQDKRQRAIAAARAQRVTLDIFPFRRESIEILRRVLAVAPKDANAACLLGDVLYAHRRPEEAETAWRAAIDADPRHFNALRDLGMSLLDRGRAEDAASLLSRAAAQRPDHLATILLLVQLQIRANQFDAASQSIESALKLRPGNDRLLEQAANLAALRDQERRALDTLTTHTFEPRHQSYSLLHLYQATRLLLASREFKDGKAAAAIDQLHKAETPPSSLGVDDFTSLKSARLLAFEAMLQQAAGNGDAAKQSWEAAAGTIYEDVEEEGLFRAIALSRTGREAKVDGWWKSFAAANERSMNNDRVEIRARGYYRAGVAAAFRGDLKSACDAFQKSIDIDRTQLWSKQALAWLDAGLL
jgi:tetratricopeptide (TPR) repeat protein